MNKLGIGLWCAAIMGAFTLLYMVRYQAQNTQEEIASIEQRILEEKEAMHVLKAEWSYLTRPERLKQLTHQLQEMEPVTQQKVIRLTDIPLQDSGTEGATEAAATQPGSEMPAPALVEPQNIPQMVTLPTPAAPRVEQVSAAAAAPLRVAPVAVVPMAPVPPPQIQPPPVRRAVASAASVARMQPKQIKAVVVQPTATEPLPSWDVLVPEETAEGTR